METTKNKLNRRQRKFCRAYIKSLNATKAAIEAGYSQKTAREIASRLLTNVDIKAEISRMQGSLEEEAQVSALKTVKELGKIAFSNISDFFEKWNKLKDFDAIPDDLKAGIKSVSCRSVEQNIGTAENPIMEEVSYTRIEMHDKVRALETISRMLGYDQPKKIPSPFAEMDFSQLTDTEVWQFHAILLKTKSKPE